MSIPSGSPDLDYTPVGLFPGTQAPAQDPKCVVIAEVFKHLSETLKKIKISQISLQEAARNKYAFLSQPKRLSLPQADDLALGMYNTGVPVEIVKQYYSFLLTEADAKKWQIIIC